MGGVKLFWMVQTASSEIYWSRKYKPCLPTKLFQSITTVSDAKLFQITSRSGHPEVFLGKGRTPENMHLLKSHFGMGVLLQICCIFSEHLFIRTPLDGCFWTSLLHINHAIPKEPSYFTSIKKQFGNLLSFPIRVNMNT